MNRFLGLVVAIAVFSALPVYAKGVKAPKPPKGTSTDTETKDCWMYIVTAAPDAKGNPVISYTESDKTKKRLHSNTQKGQCLNDDAAKKEGCNGVMAQCPTNQVKGGHTYGIVGAWVQWGTSLEDCPSLCPGFSNVSPRSYAH